ncbi:recombinase family protein, partial [Candidatus Bipolaricaulota bacterium]|nr:recombinase family protein [Candidatus Bipolaricaulota bacterium]
GYSIDVQKQVLEDYAAGHDLDTVQTFIESESAYKPGRREFSRMTDYLINHKMITAVLCYKIDRISRNISDYSSLVEKLGVEIISATEQLPSNATGRFMGDMQAAISRYSSAQLSERVKDAMKLKAKKGLYPSYAPVGYLNELATRTIVSDPKRASIIRELFETYADTDISLSMLVEWARKRGLTSRKGNAFRESTIHKLLTNPIYCGIVRWAGITSPGTHQPLISQHLFDRVQEKLHGRGHRQTKHEFPFRGLLICGRCGCKITASLTKGKYVYYHCTNGRGKCQQPYVRQEVLSQRLRSIVDNVRIPQKIVASLLEKISNGETKRRESVQARLQELETEEKEVE